MAIHFKSITNASLTDLRTNLEAFLKEHGITAALTYSGNLTSVTMESWSDHEGITSGDTFNVTGVNGMVNYIFVLRDDIGKEFFMCTCNFNTVTLAQTNAGFFMNVDGEFKYVKNQNFIYNAFNIPNMQLSIRESINIAKNLIVIPNISNTSDVIYTSDIGLYYSDSYVSAGTIYTDNLGKKYIAINQILLLEYNG